MNIIPQPHKCMTLRGELIVKGDSKIFCHDILTPSCQYFIDYIKTTTDITLQITDKIECASVHMILSDSAPSNTYSIDCSTDTVTVTCSSAEICMWAVHSLLQLLEYDQDKQQLRCQNCQIVDHPKYQYRGMHLDITRHFFDKETIIRIINLMAHVKLNVLHLHLCDDQGFRLQIDKYPLLCLVGSTRPHSIERINGETKLNNTPHQGFLSKEDARELVSCAQQLGIEIVPEIDVPGHASAMISAYPHLSCTGASINVRSDWGIFKDLLCAGNEQVYTFLQDVLDEIMDIFPSKYIHLGGDEAPKDRWCNCPKCSEAKLQLGLASFDELESVMINKLNQYLVSKGRTTICWNDGLTKLSDQDIICQQWAPLSRKKSARLVNKGRKAVMSDFFHMYFDYPYAMTPLAKTYKFKPTKYIKKSCRANILGVSGALWTEHIADTSKLYFNLLPRMLALAECAWGTNNSYCSFAKRAKNFFKIYDRLQLPYNKSAIKRQSLIKRLVVTNKFFKNDSHIELGKK